MRKTISRDAQLEAYERNRLFLSKVLEGSGLGFHLRVPSQEIEFDATKAKDWNNPDSRGGNIGQNDAAGLDNYIYYYSQKVSVQSQ